MLIISGGKTHNFIMNVLKLDVCSVGIVVSVKFL